jgi:GDPmannose 4,6-dehydratase
MGEIRTEQFHTLEFYCDWGSADEYMGIAIDVVERAPGEDFVIAAGRTVHSPVLIEQLFMKHEIPMQATRPSRCPISNAQRSVVRSLRFRYLSR